MQLSLKQPTRALAAYICLVIGAYYVWILWRYDNLILSDYIWWMIEGMRIDDILLRRGCATAFEIKHYPVPNSFTQVTLALLNLVGGWRFATTALMVVYIPTFVAAAQRLAHISGAGSGPMVLVAFAAMGGGATFWGGDSNYQFALCIAMFAAGDLLSGKTSGPRIAALSLVAFFIHAIGYAFVAGLYGVRAIYRRAPRELLALVPSALLVGWYAWGRFVEYANREAFHEGSINPTYLSPAFLVFKINTILKTGGFVNFFISTDSQSIYPMTQKLGYATVAFGIVLAAVAALLVVSRWVREGWGATRAVAAHRADERQFLLAYISVWAAIALLLPPNMLGIVEFGFRLFALGTLIALLTLNFGPARRTALVLISAFLIALNVIFLARLGDIGRYAAAPPHAVLGPAIDRVVREFSRAALDREGMPYAPELDADKCGPTEGRFTGLILPVGR